METLLLRDENIYPDNKVLKELLGSVYDVYDNFISIITKEPYSLEQTWNYYKDGKAWLCKVTYRKKTVFWLSVWDNCFKTGFYFTEKHKTGFDQLEIDGSIKQSLSNNKNIGKLIPLTVNICEKQQLEDVLKLIDFKKKLK